MNDRLNILFVAPEVAPFARTGQLADVAGSLPKALKEMGHDVRVITPQYRVTNERRYVLRDVIRLHDIKISLSGEEKQFHVKSAFLPHTKVQVYFLNYRPYFFREGLYADAETGAFYEDNDQRYEMLALGALETLRRLRWQPDVIHCHDWPSSFVPYYLKTMFKDDAFFAETRTLFSLHNGFEGGAMPDSVVARLDKETSGSTPVFKHQPAELLELGLRYSDAVHIAVSPAHPELADAAEKQAAQFQVPVTRLVNGFDGCRWNPESDPYLKNRYSAENLDGKAECRRRLLNEFGIAREEALKSAVLMLWAKRSEDLKPQLSQISELTKAGWTVIVFCEDRETASVVAASGLDKNKAVLLAKLPDEAMLHRVLAGSDVLWLASADAIEAHLHQVALRYGVKPFIDFSVKGLTLTPIADDAESPGVVLLTSAKTVKTMKAMIEAVLKRDEWNTAMAGEMQMGQSWNDVVKAYEELYGQSHKEDERSA